MEIDRAQPSAGVAIDLVGEMRRSDVAALTAGHRHRLDARAEGHEGDEVVVAARWRCVAPDMRGDEASSVATRVAD